MSTTNNEKTSKNISDQTNEFYCYIEYPQYVKIIQILPIFTQNNTPRRRDPGPGNKT